MKPFSLLSIKTKVVIIVFLGVSLSMLVSLVYFISYDRFAIKRALLQELKVLASITAARSGAAVAFMDVRVARENLSHLSIRENIQKACIYQFSGRLFAEYERVGYPCKKTFGQASSQQYDHDNDDVIIVVEKIKNMSQVLGYIVLVSDLSPVNNKVSTWLWLSGMALMLTMLGVFVTIKRLQHHVVDPLLGLTKTMGKVKENNDLSLRVEPKSKDEIGRLILAFNDMLSLIEKSNKDLSDVYKKLVIRSTEAEAAAVELEISNQKIKDHLTNAAHDLRQPLQAMSIFSDMLLSSLNRGVEKTQSSAMEGDVGLASKINSSINNLQFLFKDILNYQKFDYIQAKNEQTVVHLNALVEKLSLEFQVLAEGKNIDLRCRLSDIYLNTVPGVLERLIRNLVSNAIQYTDHGGVLISVRKRREVVFLEVWDTGCGIADDDIMRIFNRFEQVDRAESIQGNYGLGLAIVGNFVNLLGYKLVVHSKVGIGSRFRIQIPIYKLLGAATASENHREPQPEKSNTHTAIAPPTGGFEAHDNDNFTNVLLVDDDTLVLQALSQVISEWGMQVFAFSDFDSVERYFRRSDYIDPDVIISDYHLGKHNTGDRLIKLVRSLVGIEVPACIITASENTEELQHLSDEGIACLHKPLDLNELRKNIEHLCWS